MTPIVDICSQRCGSYGARLCAHRRMSSWLMMLTTSPLASKIASRCTDTRPPASDLRGCRKTLLQHSDHFHQRNAFRCVNRRPLSMCARLVPSVVSDHQCSPPGRPTLIRGDRCASVAVADLMASSSVMSAFALYTRPRSWPLIVSRRLRQNGPDSRSSRVIRSSICVGSGPFASKSAQHERT